MKNLITLLLTICCFTQLHAQELEDRRSVKSGDWNDPDTWERYTATGWVTPAAVQSTRNYEVQSGHTVTVTASATCNTLTVKNGAVLRASNNAGGTTVYLRVGHVGTSIVTIQNDGLIGGTEDGTGGAFILETSASAMGFKLTGSGVCRVARLRATANNIKNPVIEIDQDVTVTDIIAPFTAYLNSSSNVIAENFTITINEGKTVKIANPLGFFHMGSSSTSYNAGSYTYNINGTLDLSESTVTSHIIPFANNSNSTVTVNVNGLLKLGSGLNLVNSSPSADNNGNVVINVNNGGIIDATKTTTLTTGDNYFRLAGSGTVKRSVGNTDVSFPVGLQSASSANPVILNNSGTETNFSVNLLGTFDTEPVSTQVVNRQWNITPDETGANASVKLQWKSSEHGAGFDALQSVSLARLDGSAWSPSAISIVTGPDASGFYQAEASGITSFGAFSLQNSSTLPLNFTSFNASLKNMGITSTVLLTWITQNEVNTQNFFIERRATDAVNFTSIGSVEAKNISGINNYSFTDDTPLYGQVYYRLKQVDKDGQFSYSEIKPIENTNSSNLSVYPNPVTEYINISYENAGKNALIKIISTDGKIVAVYPVQEGTSKTTLEASSLSSGIYTLVYQSNQSVTSYKIVKQ